MYKELKEQRIISRNQSIKQKETINLKWAWDLIRELTNEEKKIAKKYTQKCSSSLAVRKHMLKQI